MAQQPRNPSFAEEIKQSFAKQTIMGLIGAQLSRVEPGIIEITLPYRPDLAQQHGYLHAGIVTTIADSACGYAAYSLIPPDSSCTQHNRRLSRQWWSRFRRADSRVAGPDRDDKAT